MPEEFEHSPPWQMSYREESTTHPYHEWYATLQETITWRATHTQESWRFCVMIFAGSGQHNEDMRHLSERLKWSTLPIESVDTKHGLVEIIVHGSLSDLNRVFFEIGHEFHSIINP